MNNKHAKQVTRFSSGPRHAPEARNTAPAPYPAQGIAGFQSLNPSPRAGGASGPGTSDPTQKVTSRGFNGPTDGVSFRGQGGPSMSGPGVTKGAGTSSPKSKKGPSGLGRYGTRYAPRQGG